MISIIIPIYNAERYLYECLDSVQNQTYQDFEVICVNDGSLDSSASICQEFVDKDARFVLLNQENGGVSSARNRALKEAKGGYVCFVDSDDMIEPHYLENLLNLSKDGAFAVCSYSREYSQLTNSTTYVTRYDARGFIRHILNESIEHPNICMMLFKNSIIQTQHLDFTVGCVRNEDTEFYMKYLIHEKEIVVTNYKGYYYRLNDQSAMNITTMRSLTGLEASKRIGVFLTEKGLTNDVNIDLYPTIQSMIYHLSREHNRYIYDYLHTEYNVRSIMKALLLYKAPRRKILSIAYLCLGKILFYQILSSKLGRLLPR